MANLRSVRMVYKIGMGPSSSHTMGPNLAAKEFLANFPNAARFECDLHGSLCTTGKGHYTDLAVQDVLKDVKINWYEEELPEHPNGMKLRAYDSSNKLIGEHTFYSIGGGEIRRVGEAKRPGNEIVYPTSNFTETHEYCLKNNMTLFEFIKKFEPNYAELEQHFKNVWKAMQECVEKGLETVGTLPGLPEGMKRKANWVFTRKPSNESDFDFQVRMLAAYGYAVNEENADRGIVVTAPTCGSAGTLPSVLYHMSRHRKYSDEQIIEALAVAAFIGNVARTNGSISGADVGCQGEVGVATSMAAAAIAQLIDGDNIDIIEHSAEVALEHQLGLTCDPVGGYVMAPCIERNAVAANRAFDAHAIARYTAEAQKISFDNVIQVMLETGKDMKMQYKETALGGLATLDIWKPKRHC